MSEQQAQTKAPKPRGFAAMSQERQREIASKGGKAAHEKGTAHEFTKDEARAAGKKGGNAVVDRLGSEHLQAIGRRGGRTVSADREHMARIGRKGGKTIGADSEHMAEIGRRGGLAGGARATESEPAAASARPKAVA